jgi:hypothetical protein
MNGYICFYKGERFEVYADTTFAAQEQVVAQVKAKNPRLKKIDYMRLSVTLAEKNGEQVTHVADF